MIRWKRSLLAGALAATATLGSIGYHVSLAQNPTPVESLSSFGVTRSFAVPSGVPALPATRGVEVRALDQATGLFVVGQPADQDVRMLALTQLAQLKQQLQTAQTDEQRKTLSTQIRAALGELFERDAERRRNELAGLKKRTEDTQKQLARRTQAKNELIDLQVKSFQFSLDGLELDTGEAMFFDVPVGGVALTGGGLANLAVRPDIAPGVIAPAPAGELPPAAATTGSATIFVETAAAAISNNPQLATAETQRQQALAKVFAAQQKMTEAKSAKSAENEGQSLASLKTALGEYFDADLEVRKLQLTDVEKSLQTMTTLLDKRAKAKDSILDLQLQLIVHEANGLGFFSGGSSTPAFVSGGDLGIHGWNNLIAPSSVLPTIQTVPARP